MDITPPTFWWVAAGIAVAAELGTGTFYLLMIAAGLAAAAIGAHLGLAVPMQLLAAAVVGGGATALWHRSRNLRESRALPAGRNRDVNLDIGERVSVEHWGVDGTARVVYRGSTWQARLQPGAPVAPGQHLVAAVEGNWLVLAPAAH